MLDALQIQLLTTLTAALANPLTTTTASTADFSTQDLWKLLITLLDEVMERTNAAPGPVWLEWQFSADSLDSHSCEVDVIMAGTYLLAGQTNCAGISTLVNDRPVEMPFKAKAGERITLTIKRTAPGPAAVQLLSIGAYRQLVAAARQMNS